MRTTDIYTVTADIEYFGFWANHEGIRLTLQDDPSVEEGLHVSWQRHGVSDLKRAAK